MKGSPHSAPVGIGSARRRHRDHKVDTRWDELEYASLLAAAESTGLTRGGYIRALVLGSPGPRTQRAPSLDVVALAKATAALHQVGNNLNQLAKRMNYGAPVASRECFDTLKEVRRAVCSILEIAGSRRSL